MSYNFSSADLSPQLYRALTARCEVLPAAQISLLQQKVEKHLGAIHTTLQHNEFLDIDLIQAISAVLQALLVEYDHYAPDQQASIVGATRYFLDLEDVEPDTVSILGFEDDARVLNYTLDMIGRPDLKVEV